MSKKIGTFLIIMVVICAVLMLMATANRKPAPQAETTVSTAPSETTEAPETTVAPETEPETTAPAGTKPDSQNGETSPESRPVETTPPAEQVTEGATCVKQIVKHIVEREKPAHTAVTPMAQTMLQIETAAGGQRRVSYANALAELARERKMNPIAAFWELVSDGLYKKQGDEAGKLFAEAMTAPTQGKKQYPYSGEGVRQLLTDLLALSAGMDDDLALELALLGANGTVEGDQVHFAEAEGCRYAYFSCASEQSTHILCFYLRTDGAGEWITDVEFQILNMRHASGDELTLAELTERFDRQAVALMAAAELLMTGQTRAAAGDVPFAYEIGGCKAKLERFHFAGEAEQGTLTNYRLKNG